MDKKKSAASERVKVMAEGFRKIYGGPKEMLFKMEGIEQGPMGKRSRRPFGKGRFGA